MYIVCMQAAKSACRYEQILGIARHHIPTRSEQLPSTDQQAALCQGLSVI